jgi:hypothetical protein
MRAALMDPSPVLPICGLLEGNEAQFQASTPFLSIATCWLFATEAPLLGFSPTLPQAPASPPAPPGS